jgi:hypothetical protein
MTRWIPQRGGASFSAGSSVQPAVFSDEFCHYGASGPGRQTLFLPANVISKTNVAHRSNPVIFFTGW